MHSGHHCLAKYIIIIIFFHVKTTMQFDSLVEAEREETHGLFLQNHENIQVNYFFNNMKNNCSVWL